MSIDRKPRTEQRWRDIIKDCQESGQSIRSYCLRRGISEGAFHYWRKKLPHQSEPRLRQTMTPTFAPVI
jgi:transposase-like protein